jgi:hypothetical protein
MERFLEGLDNLELVLLTGALISGIIHLYVGYEQAFTTLMLAGAGFIGGSVIFLTGYFRNLTVIASIPYTLAQFYFYYQTYGFSFGPLAAVDKVVQGIFVLTGVYYLAGKFRDAEEPKDFLKE